MEKIVGVVLVLLGGYFCGFSGNKPGGVGKEGGGYSQGGDHHRFPYRYANADDAKGI